MKTFDLWQYDNANPVPKMNARFLEEARQLEHRWKKTGLLDGIKDKYSRQTTAVLLESQRLMNEQNMKTFKTWEWEL